MSLTNKLDFVSGVFVVFVNLAARPASAQSVDDFMLVWVGYLENDAFHLGRG